MKGAGMRRWIAVIVALTVWSGMAVAQERGIDVRQRAPQTAGPRVALVVGMSGYRHVPRLANPRNDAELMAATLRDLGFTLVGGGAQFDLDKPGFDAAIQDFGRQVQGAEVALFYYAGHGFQVGGANWLAPVSANPTRAADLDFQAVNAGLVLRQMEGAGTRLNVVLLDACRNNPFAGQGLRSAGSGLATMRAPEGTLISYATQPDNVAQDGSGTNSPYAEALARSLRKPGVDVFRLFNDVGLEVKRLTGGVQQPWVSTSPITGDFYFAGRGEAGRTVAGDADTLFWSSIKDSASTADFDAYLAQFPNGTFAQLARNRKAGLGRQQVASIVPPVTSPVTQPLSSRTPGSVFRDCADCPEMVVVPSGTFMMGSEDVFLLEKKPGHRVTISRSFAVGKYEVTQGEWEAVMGSNPSKFQGSRNPVEMVSWNEAQEFIRRLNAKVRSVVQVSMGGDGPYRLLTESEWDYAARAGTTTKYPWGNAIGRGNANCNGCDSRWDEKTVPVGSFRPNAFGLYDMQGNVGEWVQDCAIYPVQVPTDESAVLGENCEFRRYRGGSWTNTPMHLVSTYRFNSYSTRKDDDLGFRLARTLP